MFREMILSLATAGVLGTTALAANNTPLIPRDVLFGNPDKAQTRISPDGRYISFLAPSQGVLNVWVAPVGAIDKAEPVTNDTKRGIQRAQWTYAPDTMVFLQDQGGDENWQIISINVKTKETRNLVDNPKVAARIVETSEKFPQEILVQINDRNEQFHDVWKANVVTGEKALFMPNPEQVAGAPVVGVIPDDDFKIRHVVTMTPDGGTATYTNDGDGKFTEFDKVPMEDGLTTDMVGFDKDNKVAYLLDSRGRNTAALYTMDLETKEKTLVAEHPKADAGGVLIHPTSKKLQAVNFNYARSEWKVLDSSIQADMDYLKTVADGDFVITSRTLDDTKWTVAYILDNGPSRSYLYDRVNKRAEFLYSMKKDLENVPLAKMHPKVIKARDGLELVSYLTLPLDADSDQDGIPERPVPMVLNVHGGPWARDTWGFDPEAQLLANRGYAVLQVNFRGSTGFGKDFVNAANQEWAGKMHDDLIDAATWAIDSKIADKNKIAIMGGSYGGYATLVGLTFTPEFFACGVDIVGPSSINTLLATIPPYWAPAVAQWKSRVGDSSTEEGRKFLDSRSPLTFVDKISKPLLIGQGANDPRVKQSEADQIAKAMTERNIPVTYVLYPDEGHGFARPENRLSFYAITEAFLAQYLGGRAEPIGDAFKGSSIKVPVDTGKIAGLSDALSGLQK
ncbi:MAG TPA: S9 family peptidase [Tepidisphaeraceae bacterium]|nr:S9 family peptidase [Tepidisphaeraceae bacterium]